MFGANLRTLSKDHSSISALSRDLGINRTQFNRYINGESFPRPDVLARICQFFEVDARVLLEPVNEISNEMNLADTSHLANFMGKVVRDVPEEVFPTGFYLFSRRSFVDATRYVRGVVYVNRVADGTYVRGYEPRDAMAMQGIPTDIKAREFRGFVMRLDDGVCATVCRRNGLTASFNFLNRVTSFQNNFWVGYVARTVPENAASDRVTRMVYEHLGRGTASALEGARTAGFCHLEDLLPFHQRLLQPKSPIR